MSALFPPWSTHAFRAALVLLVIACAAVPGAAMTVVRTSLATGQGEAVRQPIAFDHRHHVGDDGIDCRFCHAGAWHSAYAGVPATGLCMGCHAQVWNDSPALAAVRRSLAEGVPIHWQRVTTLPGFVYFNHQAHLHAGVGCVECHGRVDRMARVGLAQPMTMDWCLDCHRHPAEHLRPPSEVANMQWRPGDARAGESGADLMRQHHIAPPTTCSGCHR